MAAAFGVTTQYITSLGVRSAWACDFMPGEGGIGTNGCLSTLSFLPWMHT